MKQVSVDIVSQIQHYCFVNATEFHAKRINNNVQRTTSHKTLSLLFGALCEKKRNKEKIRANEQK